MVNRTALDSLQVLLEEAAEFSIDVHDDFSELGVLAEAISDNFNLVFSSRSAELVAAFEALENAVVYGVYVEASWEFDGSVEEAMGALEALLSMVKSLAGRLNGDA